MAGSTLDRLNLTRKKERTQAIIEREHAQLDRLARIVDLLYALAIFRGVTLLPHPTMDELREAGSLFRALLPYASNFLMMLVGLVLVLIYWGQNNRLFGNLERTDGFHAGTSIAQVTFVMMFGYFIRLGLELGDLSQILAAQSLALVAAGAMAILGWRHALAHDLHSAALTAPEARELSTTNYVEPTVAVLTIPLAWVGPDAYSLTFLLGIPVVGAIFRRIAGRQRAEDESLQSPEQP